MNFHWILYSSTHSNERKICIDFGHYFLSNILPNITCHEIIFALIFSDWWWYYQNCCRYSWKTKKICQILWKIVQSSWTLSSVNQVSYVIKWNNRIDGNIKQSFRRKWSIRTFRVDDWMRFGWNHQWKFTNWVDWNINMAVHYIL